MSLRPLDMQVMIPKVPEMSNQKHIEHQKAGLEQQYFAKESEKHIKQTHQQVIETKQMENNTINSNERRKQQSSKKHSKKNKKQDTDKKETTEESNCTIDIRI